MSDSAPGIPTEAVAEQAAGWFVRLQSEEAGQADWAEFTTWLEASPEHQAAYDRLERLSIELEDVCQATDAAGADGPEDATVVPLRPKTRNRPAIRTWIALAAAAAASVALAAVALDYNLIPGLSPPVSRTYATAKGHTQTLRLADGTRIDLNSASRIAVSYEPHARRVAMFDGEAIYDVAKDPDRPFLIAVGDREVRVVGTEFDILRLGASTTVTVRRGVVAVGFAGGPYEAKLVKGQQLTHSDGSATSAIKSVDPDTSFSWRSGRIVYDNRPLDEVVADLSRYFDTPIRLGDPGLGRVRFSGVLVIDSEDAVVRRLEDFVPVHAERSKDAIVLRSNPR